MKLVATAVVASLPFVAAPALAAPAAFTWTGFYVGVNGGYGGSAWGARDARIPAFPFAFPTAAASHDVARAGGFLFGGQVGYNYRFENRVVLGVESDMQWSDVRRGSLTNLAPAPVPWFASTDASRAALDWFGTTRIRLGFAVGRFLPYVTAGVAYGGMGSGLGGATTSVAFGLDRAAANATSATQVGWVAGAGAEYALTGNLSFKTEYLYADLGGLGGALAIAHPALYGPPLGLLRPAYWDGGYFANDRAGFHFVRAGVNYRFIGGGEGFEAPSFTVPGVDPRDWTGVYVGVNGGYGGGGVDSREGRAWLGSGLTPPVAADSVVSTRVGGFVVGAQAGVNYQLRNGFVLGVETDAQWSGLRWNGARSRFAASPLLGAADPGGGPHGAVSWFGTTRARLGYAFDRVMPYVTGGVAYGEISANSQAGLIWNAMAIGGFDAYGASVSAVKAGWAAGAGLEYAITDRLSLKTEYDYLDLEGLGGSGSGLYADAVLLAGGGPVVVLNAPSVGSLATGSVGLHMVRAGLNWRLGALPF